jgi:hypothetical protein
VTYPAAALIETTPSTPTWCSARRPSRRAIVRPARRPGRHRDVPYPAAVYDVLGAVAGLDQTLRQSAARLVDWPPARSPASLTPPSSTDAGPAGQPARHRVRCAVNLHSALVPLDQAADALGVAQVYTGRLYLAGRLVVGRLPMFRVGERLGRPSPQSRARAPRGGGRRRGSGPVHRRRAHRRSRLQGHDAVAGLRAEPPCSPCLRQSSPPGTRGDRGRSRRRFCCTSRLRSRSEPGSGWPT